MPIYDATCDKCGVERNDMIYQKWYYAGEPIGKCDAKPCEGKLIRMPVDPRDYHVHTGRGRPTRKEVEKELDEVATDLFSRILRAQAAHEAFQRTFNELSAQPDKKK